MNTKLSVFLVIVALAVVGVSMSLFTVHEREYALKFRFGEIISEDYEAGIHFKVPVVNNVLKLSRQVQTYNNPTEAFLTVELKNLLVDYFIKWRIEDPGEFYRATRGNEAVASQRLNEIVKDGIRAEFARRTVQEVVSAERAEMMDAMLTRARATARTLGVNVIDVRVKRVDLPDEVSESVFDRMREERRRIASQLRAEGNELAARIEAEADRQVTVLLAEARRDAERIRGDGDATSAAIYANAFTENPEFYAFHRSMNAYRESVGLENDIMVLEPGSDFFRYLPDQSGRLNGQLLENSE